MKRQRRVQDHPTYSRSGASYWNSYYGKKSSGGVGPEDTRANPDSLAENSGPYTPSQTQRDEIETAAQLVMLAEQILNEDQYRLFDLIGLDGKSERTAAKMLGVSQQAVHKRWLKVRQKLQEGFHI